MQSVSVRRSNIYKISGVGESPETYITHLPLKNKKRIGEPFACTLDRSLARSRTRSLEQSLAPSMADAVEHSIERSINQPCRDHLWRLYHLQPRCPSPYYLLGKTYFLQSVSCPHGQTKTVIFQNCRRLALQKSKQ